MGRETELLQLHSWLAKALYGERQIVFVTGELGIGKTTLIESFLFGVWSPASHEESQKSKVKTQKSKVEASSLAPSPRPLPPVPWLSRGQCIEQYGPGEPYMPILEALGRLCREPGSQRLIALLQHHAPTWVVQMPTLLPAAEIDALQIKIQGVTRERMLREMGEAIEAITAEHPLVLWLEDLHWSDASTLELLALLARRREPARLLVISTYRPVDVIVQEHRLHAVKQELQLHGLCVELPLGSLSEAQVAEYLVVRFPVGAQHAASLQELAQGLHRRTDGNPLFMVTAVKDLIEQQVLVQHAGQWAVQAELAAIEVKVPDNLQQLIERQIERLSAEDRRMLESASVAGMEFSAAAVAAGVEIETEIVEERCEGLVRRGQFLWAQGAADWPDGTVAARYSFLHALYQEVLYERIPTSRRQRLHQRIGERQEAAYGKRAREIAAALAVHFEQGRDYPRAVRYLEQAAHNALRSSAQQEALTLLNRSLELLQTLPDTDERAQQELRLQMTLTTPLIALKGFTDHEVELACARARALCEQIGEKPRLFSALGGLFSLHYNRGELRTAFELARQLLRLAEEARDSRLLLWAHHMLGIAFGDRGEYLSARTHFEQSLALYDPHLSYGFVQDPGATGLARLAWILYTLGYPDQALKKSHEALSLARNLLHPFSLAFVLGDVSGLRKQRGEQQAAQELEEEFLALSHEQGFSYWSTEGMIRQGLTLTQQGRRAEGLGLMRQAVVTLQARGEELARPFGLYRLANACSKTGQPEEGLRVVAEAFAVVLRDGRVMWETTLYHLKGELLLQQASQKAKVKGRKKLSVPSTQPLTSSPQGEAEACFLKAIEIAQRQQAKSLELRATMSLARLWQQQGKQHEAHTMLSDIYNWFTEGFETKDLQEAKGLLEELSHYAIGD